MTNGDRVRSTCCTLALFCIRVMILWVPKVSSKVKVAAVWKTIETGTLCIQAKRTVNGRTKRAILFGFAVQFICTQLCFCTDCLLRLLFFSNRHFWPDDFRFKTLHFAFCFDFSFAQFANVRLFGVLSFCFSFAVFSLVALVLSCREHFLFFCFSIGFVWFSSCCVRKKIDCKTFTCTKFLFINSPMRFRVAFFLSKTSTGGQKKMSWGSQKRSRVLTRWAEEKTAQNNA